MTPNLIKEVLAKIRAPMSSLERSPEEPSVDPMDIDNYDEVLSYDSDGVLRFREGSSGADQSDKVDRLTAMDKAMTLWAWRRITNLPELFKCVYADEHASQSLEASFNSSGLRFRPWLIETAQNYYARVQNLIRDSKKPALNWVESFSNNESDIDKIVMAYIHFASVSKRFDPEYLDIYFDISRVILGSHVEDAPKPDEDLLVAEKAFRQEAYGNRDVAGPIIDQIQSYYSFYDSVGCTAPYTAIVGPSGIGKSFTVQEMARRGHYVVYTSLAGKTSGAYPRRSKMADSIENHTDRDDAAAFFECYITAGLVNVELCVKYQISPAGFFESQHGYRFYGFQHAVARYVDNMYQRVYTAKCHNRERSDGGEFAFQGYLAKPLKQYQADADNLFSALAKHMRAHTMASYLQPTKSEHPVIFCMDEARALFKHRLTGERDNDQYLGFRKALRHQSQLSEMKRQKQFFALLLDTSTEILDHVPVPLPPKVKTEFAEGKARFQPIYQVDSLGVLAQDTSTGWKQLKAVIQTGKPGLTYLYTLGRPLWAAKLRALQQDRGSSGEPSIHAFATSKVMTAPAPSTKKLMEAQHLALFSYRINFNVTPLCDLTEELTSCYMRYIYGIDEKSVFIQTYQPSEPILAITSQRKMTQSSLMRTNVIRAFYKNIVKGTIHLGNLGETTASLILLFAFDKSQESIFPMPVKLSTFLSSLFSKDIVNAIKDRALDHDGLRAIWEEGTVFFNHFIRLDNDPDEYALEMAFYRGCAIFTPAGYNGCDIILPVFLPHKGTMTYILVQVMSTTTRGGLGNEAEVLLRSAAKTLQPDPTQLKPHLGLMMALRGQREETPADVVYPRSSGSGFMFNDLERIVVVAVGMDLNVYPGLLHPRDSVARPGPSAEVIELLKSLVLCPSDVRAGVMSDYHKNLRLPFADSRQ